MSTYPNMSNWALYMGARLVQVAMEREKVGYMSLSERATLAQPGLTEARFREAISSATDSHTHVGRGIGYVYLPIHVYLRISYAESCLKLPGFGGHFNGMNIIKDVYFLKEWSSEAYMIDVYILHATIDHLYNIQLLRPDFNVRKVN